MPRAPWTHLCHELGHLRDEVPVEGAALGVQLLRDVTDVNLPRDAAHVQVVHEGLHGEGDATAPELICIEEVQQSMWVHWI